MDPWHLPREKTALESAQEAIVLVLVDRFEVKGEALTALEVKEGVNC